MNKQQFLMKYHKRHNSCQSDILKKRDKYFWSYYAGMGDMSIVEIQEEDVSIIEELIAEGVLAKGDDWSWPLLINDNMRIVTFERYVLQ